MLWNSGFEISTSKAANTINGDKINATIYYTLSNSRAFLHEETTSKEDKEIFMTQLAYSDHCYGGYQTLQASTLWSSLQTLRDVNYIVSLWFLTLDKQGCHELIKAGADGVMQAMILSLGALSFSNNHLEFNMRPKDLHRNYLFRRINYGIGTHVNISVVVGEDNKAVLYAALDQNDKEYYACDGGCLDPPVQLGKHYSKFPVKKTDPPTAVLYITSDKEHMMLLKHALHVKEVMEAPAHEHHVIALHKHGHHWGGLPPFFWISILTLVLIFHLFLVKLIYNEYCVSPERFPSRYNI
ncbi:hypothetical protein GQR58_009770 [Nymphon striatum]|nr:hypothetical protein GQR58_009770 [Nymphon striatum]